MTSWILPWPNDKSRCHLGPGPRAHGGRTVGGPRAYGGRAFLRKQKRTAARLRAVSRQYRVWISHMCQKPEENDNYQTPTFGRRRRRRRKNFLAASSPHLITPRDSISRSGIPLTPIWRPMDKPVTSIYIQYWIFKLV